MDKIEIDTVLNALTDGANASLCDRYKVEWDWLEDSIILNIYPKGDSFRWIIDYQNAVEILNNLADKIESILKRYDDDKWYCHSDLNHWYTDGDLSLSFDTDNLGFLKTIQRQFYND